MTALAQNFLESFERFPEAEQLESATEILRRVMNFNFPALADEDFVGLAEDLFIALDEQEASE